MIVWQRPNLLLLDEPTNHLDLATREALAMALNEFEGTVMLVSHDRALLRSVCDEFWMVSRGGVAPFDGDLDDYQRYLLDEAKRQREVIKEAQNQLNKQQAKAAAKPAKSSASPDERRKLISEITSLDARIAKLSGEGAAIEGKLSQSPAPHEIAELGKRLKLLSDELKTLEDAWLLATESLERLTP
jgi:ATP-binding cassette subfamily F protein 3